MENYFKDIENRLKEKINFEKLEIIDNSKKHKGHKFFSEEKYHLHLKIKSLYHLNIKFIHFLKFNQIYGLIWSILDVELA